MVRCFDWRSAATAAAAVLVLAGGARTAAQAPALPDGRAVVTRHIDATGGAAALKAISSIHAKGSIAVTAQQISGELEMFASRPNKQLVRVNIAGIGRTEVGYDGAHGWSIDPVTGATLLAGRRLMEMADEAHFDGGLYLPDHVQSIVTVGRQEFDKHQAYRVKVTYTSGSEQDEFFDVETGLQLGTEARRETPLGVVPTTTFHRDYQTFGAIKLPTTHVQSALGIQQVVTFTSFEFNTVPAETFVLPPQIKALIKTPAASGGR